ncbi:MAG: hypothetical protein AAGA08_17735 [Pseudomonadota bacterium]
MRRVYSIFWSVCLCIVIAPLVVPWVWLATSETIELSTVFKRMTPVSMAQFANGKTLANIALGSELAPRYPWYSVIILDALSVLSTTSVVAAVLWSASNSRYSVWPVLALITSVPDLKIYIQFVPSSLDIDIDIFIGDDLLGTTLLSFMIFPLTLLFGGAEA